MTVHIQRLQVHDLGPLDSLQLELGKVNLFFGLNESGKTYLTEFLLHSLFRQSKKWALRRPSGKGSIEVLGLDQEPVIFTPGSSRKLEDYWEEHSSGLPLNMARLLVVKGGELALSAGTPGGVDRDTLKSALTSQALLDQIWDTISPTIRSATLEDRQIIGKNMGEIKKHNQLREEIQEIGRLLEQIEGSYSQGPARQIEVKISELQSELDSQNKAKRYLAFSLQKELEELNQNRSDLSKEAIQNLADTIRDLESSDRDLRSLEMKLENAKDRSRDYLWLESAIDLWEDKGLDKLKTPSKFLAIAGLAGFVSGAVLLILNNYLLDPNLVWIGGALSGAGFGLMLYYLIRMLDWSKQIDDSRERKAIQEEFLKKFGESVQGLADLKTRKAILQEAHISAQTTQSLLDEKVQQRKLASQAIKNSFSSLTGENIPEDAWQSKLAELSSQSEALDSEILGLKLHLGKLDIPEESYFEGPVKTQYDPETTRGLESEIEVLESNLEDLRSELDTLKARSCERTGNDINDSWREVLYDLQSLQQEKDAELNGLSAEIIAKIGLTEVLTMLRDEEDQKIIQAINTDSVSHLLFQITGRYRKLDLVDDQLFVHEDLSSYPLSDLSTGAREQVQLALRLGIAAQICGGDPLFLILDDAFQHSDWQRREALVQSTLALSQSGWQVLYLSMDEHIKKLYHDLAKPALKNEFKYFELG